MLIVIALHFDEGDWCISGTLGTSQTSDIASDSPGDGAANCTVTSGVGGCRDPVKGTSIPRVTIGGADILESDRGLYVVCSHK